MRYSRFEASLNDDGIKDMCDKITNDNIKEANEYLNEIIGKKELIKIFDSENNYQDEYNDINIAIFHSLFPGKFFVFKKLAIC